MSTQIPRDRPAGDDGVTNPDVLAVTPEMERAGLEALWAFGQLNENDPKEIVREVYRAMARAIAPTQAVNRADH
jgi:hypothetical protein